LLQLDGTNKVQARFWFEVISVNSAILSEFKKHFLYRTIQTQFRFLPATPRRFYKNILVKTDPTLFRHIGLGKFCLN